MMPVGYLSIFEAHERILSLHDDNNISPWVLEEIAHLPADDRREGLQWARHNFAWERLWGSFSSGRLVAYYIHPNDGSVFRIPKDDWQMSTSYWESRLAGRVVSVTRGDSLFKYNGFSLMVLASELEGWLAADREFGGQQIEPARMARNANVEPRGRRRGPRPAQRERVKNEMISYGDSKALSEMTEEAMSAQFKASRDVCRRARDEVLSEFSSD